MIRTISRLIFVILALFANQHANGQHPWQKAPIRNPAEIKRIVGPIVERQPSRDLNIVWVWGVDKNHARGGHEYGWVMDRFVNTLLPEVPRVTAESAMYFPTKEQWEKADLVVFYYQQREPWRLQQYELVDAYQKRGGGLMFLHLGLLEASDAGDGLAKRIGLSYGIGNSANGSSKWGVLPTPLQLSEAGTKSPILEGFPRDVDLVDELYWNLNGDAKDVTTIMTSQAGPQNGSTGSPKAAELDGKNWPVMWTTEVAKGRVFATVLGHNYFTFNDPYFRIIVLRAMAWTMHESFEPFKPLVALHLQR
jgi:hypothetical protein